MQDDYSFHLEIVGDQSAIAQLAKMCIESVDNIHEHKCLDNVRWDCDLTRIALIVWLQTKNMMIFDASYEAKAQHHKLKEIHDPENVEDYEPSGLKLRTI